MPKKLLNRKDLKPLPKGFKRVLTKKTMKIPALTLVMMMLALGFSLSDADVMAYAATTNYQVQTYGSVVQAAAPTFSDYWFQDGAGNWKVADENGKVITNAWLCDDAVPSNGKDIWYLIDANGNMVSAGLVQDQTGSIYSLETSHNGYFGMLRYQSGVYDGVYLDLESSHDGAFAKIKNQDGLAGLQGIYGLTQVNISNSNIVYTSNFSQRSSGSSTTSQPTGNQGGVMYDNSTSTPSGTTGSTQTSTSSEKPSWLSDISDETYEKYKKFGYTDEMIREITDADKSSPGFEGTNLRVN